MIDEIVEEIKSELDDSSAFVQLLKKDRKLISKFIVPDLAGDVDDEYELALSSIRRAQPGADKRDKISECIRTVGAICDMS